MPSILLLIGLPGSGKSQYALQMSGDDDLLVFDDMADPRHLPAEPPERMVLVDANLCNPRVRADAEAFLLRRYPGVTIERLFFENDPARCMINVTRRNDDRDVAGDIRFLTRVYEIPEGADVRPVWREGETA